MTHTAVTDIQRSPAQKILLSRQRVTTVTALHFREW